MIPKRKVKSKEQFVIWLESKGHKDIPEGNLLETVAEIHNYDKNKVKVVGA